MQRVWVLVWLRLLLFSDWAWLWLLVKGLRWLWAGMLLGRTVVGPFAPELS
jgi:hypothetical protein